MYLALLAFAVSMKPHENEVTISNIPKFAISQQYMLNKIEKILLKNEQKKKQKQLLVSV